MIDWKKNKERLEKDIANGMSYEELGRLYGCSGNNVKKQAKKLGIAVPVRRKINEKETFNRGKNQRLCPICGKPVTRNSECCSRSCSTELKRKEKIQEWLSGKNFVRGASQVPSFIRNYLLSEFNYCCEKCGWGKINEFSGTVPLEIHHIDGDCTNNLRDNLQLLCPNCHSLTNTNGNLNKESKRFHPKRASLKSKVQ